MSPVEFVRLLFPEELYPLAEYGSWHICFVTWPPGDGRSLREYWYQLSEVYARDEESGELTWNPRLDSSLNCYLVPHAFLEAGPRRKSNAAPMTACLWIESDDEGFSPTSVREGMPTVVLQTSPGRHHAYWRLSRLARSEEVEDLNKRLTYEYLDQDRSGWALTKLLRLPGTLNHKRQAPFRVETVTLPANLARDDGLWTHEISNFRTLPEAPAGNRDAELTFNSETVGRLTPAGILAQYQVGRRFRGLLEERAADRSSALWRLYHECHTRGMSAEECFVLARSSANNKFNDNRWNGDVELWRDVCKAYSQATNQHTQPPKRRVQGILRARLDKREKREQVSNVVWRDLLSRGVFFHDRNGNIWYRHYTLHRLSRFELEESWLPFMLYNMYGINVADRLAAYVVEAVKAKAEESGQAVTTAHLAHYDTDRHVLRVSDGSPGNVWKLDGSSIVREANGAGGVLFVSRRGYTPWNPDLTQHGREHFDRYILRWANLEGEHRDYGPQVIYTWVLALFLSEVMATRPILALAGPPGSGKSTLLQCIAWLLEGFNGALKEPPSDPRHYQEMCWDQRYVLIDGLDSPPKGLANVISTIATGTEVKRRRLYTNSTFEYYTLRAFQGITTFQPEGFMRRDCASRSLIIRSAPLPPEHHPLPVIRAQVLAHREQIWGELLNGLNRVVAHLRQHGLGDSCLRMADFGALLDIVCRQAGQDPMPYTRYLMGGQSDAALNEDVLWPVLRSWLESATPASATGFEARQLQPILQEIAARNTHIGYVRRITSARVLSRYLLDRVESLRGRGVFISTTRHRNRLRFHFELRAADLTVSD